MTINKFQGKTEEEAKEKARQEMGADVVIMNVRTIKSKVFLGGNGSQRRDRAGNTDGSLSFSV